MPKAPVARRESYNPYALSDRPVVELESRTLQYALFIDGLSSGPSKTTRPCSVHSVSVPRRQPIGSRRLLRWQSSDYDWTELSTLVVHSGDLTTAARPTRVVLTTTGCTLSHV